jgi:hypothetical protein
VLRHAAEATGAEWRQAVLVFEPAELSFHSGAASVKPLPLVGDRRHA